MNHTPMKYTVLSMIALVVCQASLFGSSNFVRNLWKKGDQWKKVVSAASGKEELKAKFFRAVKNNNLRKVREYIELGVDVNATDEFGRTPLMLAARARNLAMVKILLAACASLTLCDNSGDTALVYALM